MARPFHDLFLCLFQNPEDTLETAQQNKVDHILKIKSISGPASIRHWLRMGESYFYCGKRLSGEGNRHYFEPRTV